MKITILSTFDTFGGASISGLRLHQAFNKNGVESTMLVRAKKSNDSSIKSISTNWFKSKYYYLLFVLDRLQFLFYEKNKKVRFAFSIAKFGVKVQNFPEVKEAQIIHLFWINFGFLSLKSIQQLGENKKPIIWNLQDMWPFTGGCHYSGECTLYEQNCGNCTQFLRNSSTNDLSHYTWLRKKEAFENLNLTIVSSSNWLAEKAKTSSLFKNKLTLTIPTPIDTVIFKNIPKSSALKELGLDPEKKYLLFAAVKISDERKGFIYFEKAVNLLFEKTKDSLKIEILIFGQAQESDFINLPYKVNLLGKLQNLNAISLAYAAASTFVIPSLEDNLPNTIIEAMACGTPVVGFDIGGIPEMIDHKKTGYLAQYKSAEDLANGISYVLQEADYEALCTNSRKKAVENYSEEVVANQYKKLYESILK